MEEGFPHCSSGAELWGSQVRVQWSNATKVLIQVGGALLKRGRVMNKYSWATLPWSESVTLFPIVPSQLKGTPSPSGSGLGRLSALRVKWLLSRPSRRHSRVPSPDSRSTAAPKCHSCPTIDKSKDKRLNLDSIFHPRAG